MPARPRTARGHIFNPAALALLISIPRHRPRLVGRLPDLPWPFIGMLLVGGSFVVDRINKFPVVLSFMATYFTFFTLTFNCRSERCRRNVSDAVRPVSRVSAMFMLTDPPTSPSHERDQVWLGALVGVTSCVTQLAGVGQAYLVVGVLVGNLALVALRLGRTTRATLVPARLRREV